MTYIVKYLPPLNELKKQLTENPELADSYMKCDSFIGDEKSIDYLMEFITNRNTPKIKKMVNKIVKPFLKKY